MGEPTYVTSFLQRYRKHSRMNSNVNRPTTPNELLQNFPNLRKVKSIGKDNIFHRIMILLLHN